MKKNTFIEGTVIATIAIVFIKILGMLYVIPFYKAVGPLGAALYAYAYNIYIIFLDISSAGIPVAISKIISEYNTLGMIDAKTRAFKVGKSLISIISFSAFLLLFIFARSIAVLILGSLKGGNTINDVTFVIRCISFAVLIIPYLSVSKGYLQGHNFISVSSISQVIEQVARISFIILGSTLAIYVFHLSITSAVSIAVFGATIGGISALIYIRRKIRLNKKALSFDTVETKDDISNKEIRKKIISYAIPFVIINIASNIYNFVDMVLILRTLNHLGFNAKDVEFIASAIATWAPKINMVIASLAMGMSISIIPIIGSSFTANNWSDVCDKFNKAIQIILVVSLPMAIGLSALASPTWSIFYGASRTGASILALNVFVALFLNLAIITGSTLQSLNKYKIVYKTTFYGFVANAILDVPLMLLFHKLGLPAYYGAIVATINGLSIQIIITLRTLYKENNITYQSTKKTLYKLIMPLIAMIIVIIIGKTFISYNVNSRFSCILYVGIISLLGSITYLILTFKNGLLKELFGEKFLKKLTLNK